MLFILSQIAEEDLRRLPATYIYNSHFEHLMASSFEKQLTLIWEGKRPSHLLCISPLNLTFIQNESTKLDKIETYTNQGFNKISHFANSIIYELR